MPINSGSAELQASDPVKGAEFKSGIAMEQLHSLVGIMPYFPRSQGLTLISALVTGRQMLHRLGFFLKSRKLWLLIHAKLLHDINF